MSDEELLKILSRLAKKMMEEKRSSSETSVLKGEVFDTVDVDSPHGIYIYDPGRDKWVLIRRSGDYFTPENDGIYIIYFDNTGCPACRIYDLSWYTYIKLIGRNLKNTYFVIILCGWFAGKCESEAAKKSFTHYNIHASPTTILQCVKDKKIILQDRFEGAKSLDYLVKKIDEFSKTCHKKQ